jgi:hypothetical protein
VSTSRPILLIIPFAAGSTDFKDDRLKKMAVITFPNAEDPPYFWYAGEKFIGGRYGTTCYDIEGNQACEIQFNVLG